MEKGYIICVDDETAILTTLSQQLKEAFSQSHKIKTAISGEEALELIELIEEKGETVEMVISDQVMPGIKGDELLSKVHERNPEIIKILLTGQAGFSDLVNAVNNAQLNYFVAKPWDGETLKKKLGEFLESFRQTMDNQRLLRNLEEKVKNLQ